MIQPISTARRRIAHVKIRVQPHYTPGRVQDLHPFPLSFGIHWNQTGMPLNRVDVFLYSYPGIDKWISLKGNIPNNGHSTLPVPGNIWVCKHYIARIKTCDGKSRIHNPGNDSRHNILMIPARIKIRATGYDQRRVHGLQ